MTTRVSFSNKPPSKVILRRSTGLAICMRTALADCQKTIVKRLG